MWPMVLAVGASVCGAGVKHGSGRCLAVGKFGPVFGVVQRPKRLAQKNAVRFALKRYAVLWRKPAFAGSPVGCVPQIGVAKDVSDLGLRAKVLHNHVGDLLSELFVFFHAKILT